MIGLDTNVIVRFLVKDDQQQSSLASSYINKSINKGESLMINNIVFCELVWVLKACYNFSKIEIISVLEKILLTKQFEFENKDIIRQSVKDYANGNGDLSDYLIGRLNHVYHCDLTLTFDRALKESTKFKLLH